VLGETQTTESDVERALELAEPDGRIWPLGSPRREPCSEHDPRHRTAHGRLLKDILDVLTGRRRASRRTRHAARGPQRGRTTGAALLPSQSLGPESGRELYLSFHRVKTHIRNIYAKLGVHRPTEAVEYARDLDSWRCPRGSVIDANHLERGEAGSPSRARRLP
jgi:LuxR family transcriptional regulator, maltose regulon positive regulatory protein